MSRSPAVDLYRRDVHRESTTREGKRGRGSCSARPRFVRPYVAYDVAVREVDEEDGG